MFEKSSYHHGDLKNALIRAGIEILADEGVSGLSLRKVAKRAGVSHTAPYAHFADKQTLVAAISTEGYKRLYEKVAAAAQQQQGDPVRQLIETAWAYVEFALNDPAHFKITLSSVVEKEEAYPEFVEMTTKNFDLVVEVVLACQQAGILRPGPADLMAITLWSQVHGFVTLVLENQISHTLMGQRSLKEILVFSLNQITMSDISSK